jgi:hypothetical protein
VRRHASIAAGARGRVVFLGGGIAGREMLLRLSGRVAPGRRGPALEHSDRRLLGICLDQCSHPFYLRFVVLLTRSFYSIIRKIRRQLHGRQEAD